MIPNPFLATSITRRESYPGPWLPEPIDTRSPLHQLEQTEALEWALLLLHEAFQYSHAEIASVLNTTIDNSRQILSRARKH